jgi:hypothetical protein
MGESMLQREFRERDVQRMRNLITKNFNNKTTTQVGYTKTQEEHKEGDVWEENNKSFTIKNGIKVTLSKLDNVKKLLQIPLCCPKCNKPMKKGNIDKKMWAVHKMCFDCVIEYETLLKRDGKYEEYERTIIKAGAKEYIYDLEQAFEDLINSTNDNIVTEDGHIENWSKGNTDNLQKELKEYIDKLKNEYNP